MNKPELLPCPFCGGSASLLVMNKSIYFTVNRWRDFYSVFCDKCKACTNDALTEKTVVNRWNRRA